jgi:peptidoglycan/xylan/chitin deacetylase (PgdA/CDA1 family)
VTLSAADRSAWAPAPTRSSIPVLVYRRLSTSPADVSPEQFARQMALLHHAGYRTISLSAFVRFLRGEPVALPARPLLLTFDDGRLESWRGSDATLERFGFNAVVFVDAGRVAAGAPDYLTWRELAALQRSGRWEVQAEAGTGKFLIKWGPGRDDVGPFYAFRGTDEVMGGWRERVFTDLDWALDQLTLRVRGYRPLAIAPPYGNYGQLATNDPAIPREMFAHMRDAFGVVFTQDRRPLAVRGSGLAAPVGRLEITRARGEAALRSLLA